MPANSASETTHDGGAKSEPVAAATLSYEDPTRPYTTPVGSVTDAGTKKGEKATGNVSKAECSQLFDKYIELAMSADGQLEGLPSEIIAQAKAQARQQKGDPCEREKVSRTKYNCAMAATSTGAWQACMK